MANKSWRRTSVRHTASALDQLEVHVAASYREFMHEEHISKLVAFSTIPRGMVPGCGRDPRSATATIYHVTWHVAAILFDIDGTLVDSTPIVDRVWRSWASSRSLDVEEILRTSHGRRARDTLADLVPAEDIETAAQQLEAMELELVHEVVALPATQQILTSLPPERWAAVTSGPRVLMEARLKAAGLPVPKVMITAEDVSTGKPNPEGYHLAATRLGFDPAECLVVEDAPAGVGAGRANGGRVIAVATSHDPSVLTDADVILSDLTKLRIAAGEAGLALNIAP